jgi:rfaE bifunctional protein kinase chain/domain
VLDRLRTARIAVVGDYCIDAYWFLDLASEERSVETGLQIRRVQRQRYSPGGAGNVLMNLYALEIRSLFAFGVIGEDPFGGALIQLLRDKNVDTSGMLVQKEMWDTHVYGKPYLGDQEQHRLDFGGSNQLSDTTAAHLVEALRSLLSSLDVVVINEQIMEGIHASSVFQRDLLRLIRDFPEKKFLLDSRHRSENLQGTIRKINEHEAARLMGISVPDSVPLSTTCDAARALHDRWRQPLIVTRGQRGCIVCDATGLHEIPGLLILKRTDTVGAGDSMLAGTAAGLAAGCNLVDAAHLGNFVAGVTVQKLFQTGTATPEEVLTIGADPDFLYCPELSDDVHLAHYLPDTSIEITTECRRTLPTGARTFSGPPFTHVLLDHDGTLSTLRQGWEEIMEPMMVRAILGSTTPTPELRERVRRAVEEFIAKTTGIQTLRQMEGLAAMVRDFGFVLQDQILSAALYKKEYTTLLHRLVDERVEKLKVGVYTVNDVVMCNAVHLIAALHGAGLTLYLASGTDQNDVREEAAATGLAPYFEGRIYGAVDEEGYDVKKIVVQRILREIGKDHGATLLGIGDGPVEIREVRKAGGFTIGIASDEIQRRGWNLRKRTRLIQAGADLLVPDYSQLEPLLELLGIHTSA